MKTTLMISALAVSLNACAIDTVETDDGDVADGVGEGSIRRLSANALSPAALAQTTIGASALTQSYADALSQTAAGREALKYLIGCGLAAGTSITSQYNCNPITGACQNITYTGELNLASSWRTSAPTLAQQRLVSSCVLARMNELSKTITISLRGNGYGLDPNETTTHVYKEGSFFGNVFAGADNYWGACDADGPTHQYRQCAQDGHCAPTEWAGACETACTFDANGDARTCLGANGVLYAQPTTVWLNAVTP